MVVPRASARWSVQLIRLSSSRAAHATTRTRPPSKFQKRGYASSRGHESHKSSSDLPWAIGSLVVTVPSVAYLLQPNPNKHHGHGHDEGEHGAHDDHKESPEEGKENVDKDSSDSQKDHEENKGQDSSEQDQSQQDESTQEPTQDVAQDTPDPSDEISAEHQEEKDGGGNVEGVQFKGATSGGSREGEAGDTRERIPDSKGFYKKRIESGYGNRQGALDENDSDDDDKPAASKSPSFPNSQSEKQEGLSNTDTKHSTDVSNDPNKSKKGEGFVETAKIKGTVDPGRPQI